MDGLRVFTVAKEAQCAEAAGGAGPYADQAVVDVAQHVADHVADPWRDVAERVDLESQLPAGTGAVWNSRASREPPVTRSIPTWVRWRRVLGRGIFDVGVAERQQAALALVAEDGADGAATASGLRAGRPPARRIGTAG